MAAESPGISISGDPQWTGRMLRRAAGGIDSAMHSASGIDKTRFFISAFFLNTQYISHAYFPFNCITKARILQGYP